MSTDIRTDYQKRSEALRLRVAALFQKYREKFPEASDNRIFELIAADLGLTRTGVRGMCIKAGVATEKTKTA